MGQVSTDEDLKKKTSELLKRVFFSGKSAPTLTKQYFVVISDQVIIAILATIRALTPVDQTSNTGTDIETDTDMKTDAVQLAILAICEDSLVTYNYEGLVIQENDELQGTIMSKRLLKAMNKTLACYVRNKKGARNFGDVDPCFGRHIAQRIKALDKEHKTSIHLDCNITLVNLLIASVVSCLLHYLRDRTDNYNKSHLGVDITELTYDRVTQGDPTRCPSASRFFKQMSSIASNVV